MSNPNDSETTPGSADSTTAASSAEAAASPVPEITQPMLEVHAPHESIHTWKSFFVHIATIVVGLLIAVGLEQTVELIHHRNQVAEIREALRIERAINVRRFAAVTEEFHRFLPKLQTNLAVFQYLREHPGAPPETWPGKLSWYAQSIDFSYAAWDAAQNSGAVQYIPQLEVRRLEALYLRLKEIENYKNDARATRYRATQFYIANPDPSTLSVPAIDREIDLLSEAIQRFVVVANRQRNMSRVYPDFQPAATAQEIQEAWRVHWDPDEIAAISKQDDQLREYEEHLRPLSTEAVPR